MVFYGFLIKALILCCVMVGVSYIIGLAFGMNKDHDEEVIAPDNGEGA